MIRTSKKIEEMYKRYIRFFGAIFIVALIATSYAKAIPALNLWSLENFVAIAGSTITGVPPISMVGNVGLSPAAGSFIIGFSGVDVNGILYVVDATGPAGAVQNSVLLTTAKGDLTIAYNDAAGRTPVPTGPFLNPGSGNMGGLNLVPGLYKFTSAAAITGSNLTLTGSATDVWIFQIGTSLNVGSGINIILAGGARASNIFWQVGSSATLGTYSVFKGTILADQSISLGTGATIEGRTLAFSGAVTMASGVTTNKPVLVYPLFASNPSIINFGNVLTGTTKRDSVTVTNNGTAPLIISSVSSSNIVFTTLPTGITTIAPGGNSKFYITFAPTVDGLRTAYIIFNHNADGLKDTVNVSGTGISPQFASNPSSINFGNVLTGTTKRDSVTVTNNGTAPLIISSVSSSNIVFTTLPTGITTIAPGGNSKFYITYAPTVDGLRTAYIIFNHNADGLKDTVNVSGIGISPQFASNPSIINFGNVLTGTTKRDSVTVTNNGTAPLIISSVSSSNIVFTTLPTGITTIAPGGNSKFYITYAPTVDGLRTAYIIFNHNADGLKDTVNVSGTGISPQFASNPSIINFGNVLTGTTKRDSITVTNNGTAPLIISSVSSSNIVFTTLPTGITTIAPGGNSKFYITYAPTVDGLRTAYIIFNHNTDGLKDTVNVSGTGISPQFASNPSIINFGNVLTGTTKRDSVIVTNNGTAPLIISSVSSSNIVFTTLPTGITTIAPGGNSKFYITFAPTVDGLRTAYIIFNHNADGLKDTVNVSGTGISPQFTSNPSIINFGNVRTGTTKRDSVTVTNNGTAPLIISSVSSSNIVFTTLPTGITTIAPGGNSKFYITYAPTVDGLRTAYIIFNHNADGLKDTVNVSGTGISPLFTSNQSSINFGNVRTGTTKRDSVTVTNNGTAPLIISSVSSSNIVFTTLPTGITTIAPGGNSKFYITFAPTVDGLRTGLIIFNNNTSELKDTVNVSGTGISPLFTSNQSSINFGNVRTGTTKRDSVTVTNNGTAPLIISSVSSSNTVFTFLPTGITTIAPGGNSKFYITFAPTVDGLRTGLIIFNNNTNELKDTVNVSGTGISPLFTSNQSSINFGNVRTGTTKRDSVTITNIGTSPLIISSMTSSNPIFTINPMGNTTIAPDGISKFYITFAPTENGLITGSIIFNNNTNELKDTVNVSGIGVSPIFTASQLYVIFGNVRLGTTKLDSISITNTGTSNLEISNVTSTNPLFTFAPTAATTIAPGENHKYYFTFSPIDDGYQVGYIIYHHNTDKLMDTVDINGMGSSTLFAITKQNINFGNVGIGTIKRDSVLIANNGTENLIIYSMSSTNPLFTFSPTDITTLAPGTNSKFYISFAPVTDGPQFGNIIFNHNADNLSDSITVSGIGVSTLFTMNKTIINFGNVRTGTTKRDSVIITNFGTATLIISSLSSTNPTFTFAPTGNTTIAPGANKKYYITYAPVIEGLRTGYIIFNHNANNLKDSVFVSGIGISPLFASNKSNIDFGEVRTGTIKRDSVIITNNGTSNLIINNINSTNQVFTFTPTVGVTIAPGTNSKFYITFAPEIDGQKAAYVIFTHNADNLKDSIIVTGFGVSPLFVSNQSNLNFGNVRTGTTKRDSITVTNYGTTSLIISSITSTNPLFTFTPINSTTIAPGRNSKYYITFAPIENGLQTGTIIFNHNANNASTTINVRGSGVSPLFTINPKSINYGNVNNDKTKIDSVIVTNSGTSDLIITSLSSSNTHFTIISQSALIAPGSSKKFYIAFTPLTSGFYSAYIRFNFNASNAKDSIFVSGTGIGVDVAPIFTVTPTSLNYGELNSGFSKIDSVTVQNTGTGNLTIYSINSSNVFYTVSPQNAIMIPGESKKFYITFLPLALGTQNGIITFYHNAAIGNDKVYVTGKSVGQDLSPLFSCCPTTIDFGTVFIDKTKQKSVYVTNMGTSDLKITDVNVIDYQYSITPIIATIAPGSTFEFFITFAPLTVGQTNSKIIFYHNAGIDTINAVGIGMANLPLITIEEARGLPLGTEFVIEGIITRALGSYTRIQDNTGALTIIQDTSMFYREVRDNDIQMTDLVRIQGRISELDHLKVIQGANLTAYQRLSRFNAMPVPVKVTLAELASNGEAFESRLITLEGLTIRNDWGIYFEPSSTYMTKDESDITNAVSIRIGKLENSGMCGMPFIEKSVTFEGVLSQTSTNLSNTGYLLTPVLPIDLHLSLSSLDNESDLYSLSDNYPNPFNASTAIKYNINSPNYVTLKVFNMLGQEVKTLVNEYKEIGTYTEIFIPESDVISLGTSVYYYRLVVGSQVSTKQMIFTK